MTYDLDLNKAYEEGIISSREYVDMSEWLATAEDRDDPDEIDLVNLRRALEDGVVSPDEYVCLADFLFHWLELRLALSAEQTESSNGQDGPPQENFGGWRVEPWPAKIS